MPQLDPTWFASQLFWLAVCFVFLYILLSRLVLPPLQNVMGSRKTAMDGDLAAAQDFKQQAELAKQTYEKTLADSRAQAQSIIAEADATSKEEAAKSLKALEGQISLQLASASKNINAKKQELLSEIMPKATEFASIITEKLTGTAPTAEQVKSAVQSIN